MTAKRVQFIIQGMNRDLSESKFSEKFSYENKNLRLIADDSNDTLSLVNEKGTLVTTIQWDESNKGADPNFVLGIPIGQEIIDNELILFTAKFNDEENDHIYKFWFDSNGLLNGSLLFEGDLNFNAEHPIESISIYESEHLKKVYWTDGVNQPRLINIAATSAEIATWTNESFDFVPNIKLDEDIEITRNIIAGGVFAAGVIQYSFSYYNLYGQESNIFYTSPLYYTSFSDRGASPDATVSNSFDIDITKFDRSFDYIRIYATLRTSIDAVPQARRVVDIPIKGIAEDSDPNYPHHIRFTDTGVEGESIDPTSLLYIGGEDVYVETLEHKDNTLFLGNIGIRRPLISDDIKQSLKAGVEEETNPGPVIFDDTTKKLSVPKFDGYYSYDLQLRKNSEEIKVFKSLEWYRFGIQAQYKNGKWSEPIYISDQKNRTAKNHFINATLGLGLVSAHMEIASSIVNNLLDEGYVNIRPVVVYPTLNDRECICQGVLNPTVFNVEDRWTNSPFAQSSWFFRPNSTHEYNGANIEGDTAFRYVNNGYGAEFRHNFPIPGNKNYNSEIQSITVSPQGPLAGNYGTDDSYVQQWVSHFKECFYIDQSIFTMHSPDIEFNNEIMRLDGGKLKLRIVGIVPISSSFSDVNIITETPPNNFQKDNIKKIALGFYKETISRINHPESWKNMLSAPLWMDNADGFNNKWGLHFGFVVYPWQRTGALNNCDGPDEAGYIASKLKSKVMSIFRYSNVTKYYTLPAWQAEVPYSDEETGVSDIKFFNSDTMSMIKLNKQEDSLHDVFYYGNIDKLVARQSGKEVTLTHDILPDKSGGYPIAVTDNYSSPSTSSNYEKEKDDYHALFRAKYKYIFDNDCPLLEYDKANPYSNAPVSMKYKSTPHAVIALKYTNEEHPRQRVLPTIQNTNGIINSVDGSFPSSSVDSSPLYEFWDKQHKCEGVLQDDIMDRNTNSGGFLWLGELYNDTVVNRFGGISDEAIANNKWEPCGPKVKLRRGVNVTVRWTEGDTYFQRYDCLKTYPFAEGDENSIVDILSFMCETRVNIDGRFDRMRGNISNLQATPETFNLLNKVYSQRNNFFEYRITDPNLLMETKYSNIITWGKTKVLGEIVDQWANVSLATSLELDGTCGKLNKIDKLNGNLIAFQDKGISQILYNDNVQISSTAGVPIEIANSGKVQGKRYISSSVGCTNKWSISASPSGLYFVDSVNKDFYLFNGQLTNLSDKFGFHSWAINNFKEDEIWNPYSFKGCITHYEPINGDTFLIMKDSCLAFSEPLGNFSSFYDYNDTPYLSVMGNRAIWWKYNEEDGVYKPFLHREGEYNNFFGVYKPYWITFITNPNESKDKIFNTLEFRADAFTKDSVTNKYNVYNKDHIFDTLNVWTEYQEGISNLTDTKDYPSTLKKKFRIWRANIPRNNTNKFGDNLHNYSRDRIRNPWAYVKLGMQKPSNYSQDKKVILHDLIIDYFE